MTNIFQDRIEAYERVCELMARVHFLRVIVEDNEKAHFRIRKKKPADSPFHQDWESFGNTGHGQVRWFALMLDDDGNLVTAEVDRPAAPAAGDGEDGGGVKGGGDGG